jgi:hypothetical protein
VFDAQPLFAKASPSKIYRGALARLFGQDVALHAQTYERIRRSAHARQAQEQVERRNVAWDLDPAAVLVFVEDEGSRERRKEHGQWIVKDRCDAISDYEYQRNGPPVVQRLCKEAT